MNCIICNNDQNNQTVTVPEFQLGLREDFHYQQCGSCGSMQLLDPPKDFSKYYPNEDYYSFKLEMKELKPPGYLRTAKTRHLVFNKKNLVGALLSIGYKEPEFYGWMRHTHARFNSTILDVGTGNGSLLTRLYKMGYKNLTGIDPFINESHDYGAIKILKKEIFDLDQKFDVIMMHHSLEHMFEPVKALQKASSILNDNGRLLVRIPIMGNYGWKRFNIYWCGLDAPRHIFIPSEKGMKMLADQAGFTVEKLEYDSSDYVIWCSEQYLRGIALHSKRSRMMTKTNSTFTEEDIEKYKTIIAEQNKKNNGDTAAFYLKKNTSHSG